MVQLHGHKVHSSDIYLPCPLWLQGHYCSTRQPLCQLHFKGENYQVYFEVTMLTLM